MYNNKSESFSHFSCSTAVPRKRSQVIDKELRIPPCRGVNFLSNEVGLWYDISKLRTKTPPHFFVSGQIRQGFLYLNGFQTPSTSHGRGGRLNINSCVLVQVWWVRTCVFIYTAYSLVSENAKEYRRFHNATTKIPYQKTQGWLAVSRTMELFSNRNPRFPHMRN